MLNILYGIIIFLLSFSGITLSAGIELFKKQPNFYSKGKVVSVSGEGSIIEIEINGEVKNYKLNKLYPVGEIVPVFFFNDDTDEVVQGFKGILDKLSFPGMLAGIIGVVYLLNLMTGRISGFAPFITIFASEIFCFLFGCASVIVDSYSKNNSIELEVEFDTEIKLENSEKELYSPVFRYIEGEETKYLKGFEYMASDTFKKVKNGKVKIKYNDDEKSFCRASRFKMLLGFRILSFVGIFAPAILFII